ncbi:MAG: GMP synthase [Desulfurococcaceae archaeon]
MLTDVSSLINRIVENLRKISSQVDCAVACVSGGVDSTVSAVLAKMVLGDKVHPVFIDTGFMRSNEAMRVVESLKELLKIEVYDFSESFVSRLEEISDAEEKRRVFRGLFYEAVKSIASEKGCSWIVQGTIKADVVETLGKLKTQHNVLDKQTLEKYGFKVIEPLVDLYKHEVRAVAELLNIPKAITHRQPFPGPGLLVRAVGKPTREKIRIVRELTDIVENLLSGKGFSQYFPAVWEYRVQDTVRRGDLEYWVFDVKVTGVTSGRRTYGHPVVVSSWPSSMDVYDVYKLVNTEDHPHVLVKLHEKTSGSYVAALRVVKTVDFMTAEVPRVNPGELRELVQAISEHPEIRLVALDVTPKPPATIEYE